MDFCVAYLLYLNMTDKDTLLNFIDDYRCHSVLWDTSDKAYTNKNKRNEAYESLGKKYNMSVKGVKTKIKNLRSYFSKEQQKMLVKKVALGQKTGSKHRGLRTNHYYSSEIH